MTASQSEVPLKEIGKSGYVGITFELMHDALMLLLTYRKGYFNSISVKRKGYDICDLGPSRQLGVNCVVLG